MSNSAGPAAGYGDTDARWRRLTLAAAIFAVVAVAAGMLAPRLSAFTAGGAQVVGLHLLMELVAVIIAMLIVVVSWHSIDARSKRSTNIMICGFLIVAVCDLAHALTFEGMPPLLGSSGPARTIFFWLMGRSFEVITLCLVAVGLAPALSRRAWLGAGLLTCAAVLWLGSRQIGLFPATFIEGQGVTAFKAGYEYALCLFNIAVALLFWRRASATGDRNNYLLALSGFVMGVGEIMFTSFVAVYDFQVIVGHVFKIASYALLYRAVFVTTMRAPYAQARDSEHRLQESTARFRSLTQMSTDWYWEQDADLRFTATTGWHDDGTGFSSEVHHNRHRWELPDTEIVGQTWDEHKAVLAGRKPFRDLLLKRTTADGRALYISVAGEPIFDEAGAFTGYRGVSRNITERVAAEREAQSANELLRMAVENLSESIAVTDADDRIVVNNRNFRELNHNTHLVDPGHLYADHIRAGIAIGNYPDSAGREEAWLAERLQRRRSGGVAEIRRQDGKWLRVTDQKLPNGGAITFALDITAIKLGELALRGVNAELEKRVAERTAEIEAFMYSVSHDLRAPIRAIDGYSALLQQALALPEHDEKFKLFDRIRANTARMALLLRDLLDLSRYSTLEMRREEIDMRAEVDSVIADHDADTGVACFEIGELPPCQGDRALVRQVWSNLIANALKYSSKRAQPLVGIGFTDGAYFVSDNGTGFDMAYADKLFKLFSRLHHERDFAGTGIGLAVVKRIVERHGGRIRAESVPDGGAVFSFSLPLPQKAPDGAAPAQSSSPGAVA